MLTRSVLVVLIIAGASRELGAPAAGITRFLPTSSAIDIARTVVKAEGFDLSRKNLYYFDLLPAAKRQGASATTITIEFYWHDNLNKVISIDGQSGWAFDTWNCKVFDYPALRGYRGPGASVGMAVAMLKAQSDCDKFTVLRVPKTQDSVRYRQH